MTVESPMNDERPLRILIVDDSSLVRRILREMLQRDPGIRVIGEAVNGEEAIEIAEREHPDLITMDVRMPLMDGLQATEHLMAHLPTPILVLTASLARYDIDITFRMLEAGALDVLEKPDLTAPRGFQRIADDLVRKVKTLARVRVIRHIRGRRPGRATQTLTPLQDQVSPARRITPTVARRSVSQSLSAQPVIVIGASTGGPRVVRRILSDLPADLEAAILIIQHIAVGFGTGMAEWLGESCRLPVKIAVNGDQVNIGRVIVAPDNRHLVVRSGGRIEVNSEPPALQYPSIDVGMQSAAEIFGPRTIGVLLTGMGRDGAVGMQTIHSSGGQTIAQDEQSCSIDSMPRAALELGVVQHVLPPERIAAQLARWTQFSAGA